MGAQVPFKKFNGEDFVKALRKSYKTRELGPAGC